MIARQRGRGAWPIVLIVGAIVAKRARRIASLADHARASVEKDTVFEKGLAFRQLCIRDL